MRRVPPRPFAPGRVVTRPGVPRESLARSLRGKRLAQRLHSSRRTSQGLSKDSGASALLDLRRKPRNVPAFWRHVDFWCSANKALLPDADIRRSAQLVLSSRAIPHVLAGSRADRIYVPPLYMRMAAAELNGYAHENQASPQAPLPCSYHNAHLMLFFLLALILWYGVTAGWWDSCLHTKLSFAAWKQAGSLDVFRTAHLGEWWRTITALTLHSDSKHLLANVAFGAPFLIMLGRRVGTGPALLLLLVAGATGNVFNTLYRPPSHDSLGFSTALFAVVGLISALLAVRVTGGGRVLLPLAAGVGILASLGTGDMEGRIDYGAHVFGLLAGLIWGVGYGLVVKRFSQPPLWARALCGIFACCLLVLAWHKALRP